MKRATCRAAVDFIFYSISIHALVKRATIQILTSSAEMKNFNPRPREEGDLRPSCRGFAGAYFNPRPREEGDKAITYRLFALSHFNPRPRKEGDEIRNTACRRHLDFNPRPREEGDHWQEKKSI